MLPGRLPCQRPTRNRNTIQFFRFIQTTLDEMETYRDDRSDTWQESEGGDVINERIDALESIIGELDNIAG